MTTANMTFPTTRTNAILAQEAINDMPSTDSKSTKLSDEKSWDAVVARDRGHDGKFVFAVSTTGVYCRPSCAARRPRRENVTFFPRPDQAEKAGYRACLRCRPQLLSGDPQA